MHIKTSIGLLVFNNKFKVIFNSFSGPFANYASEIYSFRVVMFVGGFLRISWAFSQCLCFKNGTLDPDLRGVLRYAL